MFLHGEFLRCIIFILRQIKSDKTHFGGDFKKYFWEGLVKTNYDLSVLSVLLYLYYLLSLLFLCRKGIWVIYCETDVQTDDIVRYGWSERVGPDGPPNGTQRAPRCYVC